MSITRSVLIATTLAVTITTLATPACSRRSSGTETSRQEHVTTCMKEGDRCEFAPGKIGLCTAKEGSTTLTCVSLH